MALTEDQKVQIITAVAVAANFHVDYTSFNRNWFVRHMIEHYAAAGTADANIQSTVSTFVQQCKTLADAKKDFPIGVTFSSTVLRNTRRRRIEIIYGALAMKPDLALTANANYLDFMIRRRFRTVMRMDYFVNPNYQGYFRYPATCPSNEVYKVNDDATSFWVEFNGGWNGSFFRLSPPLAPPASGPDPGPAFKIEKLFRAKRNPCEGNLLDCARVLSILFMDSLFEAANKDNLLGYMAGKPDTSIPVGPQTSVNSYLGICHVGDTPNSQFITDTSAEGLFSKVGVPATDLQVGDHAYIYNHPLYKVFHPNGSWRGEHALVYDEGDRTYTNQTGFMFGGHGKEGTLYQFYSAFLQELKTHLERAYKIGKVHLKFMQTGVTTDGSHSLSSGGTVNVTTIPATGIKIYEYNQTISYTDYEHSGRTLTQSRYVIGHGAGLGAGGSWIYTPYIFWIAKETTTAALLAANVPTDPIPFFRNPNPPPAGTSVSDSYSPEFYRIPYQKEANPTPFFYDLFQRSGTTITMRQITINDLFADPFLVNPGTSNLQTTQPRVDTSATYQSFLRLRGGIT